MWLAFSADLAAEEVIKLIVQINGKVRARIEVGADIGEEEAKAAALADENVQRHIGDKKAARSFMSREDW